MEHSAWLTGSLIYLAAAVIAVPRRALPRPRLDHRLPRRRHPDRPVGPEARDAARGHAAVRRVRRRPDALPGRPRARAAAALVAAEADLRLGQRAAVRLGAAARARRARLRHRLAPRRRRRARPGDVVDGDRPRRPRRAQRDGDDLGRGRPQRRRCCRTSPRSRSSPCIPFLAVGAGGEGGDGGGWLGAAKAIGTIAVIILGGRLLLRPALRWIANSDTPEIFTAASLLLVVATAALMNAVGLSMALGAFLAGVLLAESEYRRELETDIEPFKGLLLGLFFIAVGMSIDFARRDGAAVADRRDRARLPADQGGRALGDGAHDADPAARAAGLHHPARAGRRVRLRRLPGGRERRRDRGAGVVVPGRRGHDLDAR